MAQGLTNAGQSELALGLGLELVLSCCNYMGRCCLRMKSIPRKAVREEQNPKELLDLAIPKLDIALDILVVN